MSILSAKKLKGRMEYPTTDFKIRQSPLGDDDEADECVMSAAFINIE